MAVLSEFKIATAIGGTENIPAQSFPYNDSVAAWLSNKRKNEIL